MRGWLQNLIDEIETLNVTVSLKDMCVRSLDDDVTCWEFIEIWKNTINTTPSMQNMWKNTHSSNLQGGRK